MISNDTEDNPIALSTKGLHDITPWKTFLEPLLPSPSSLLFIFARIFLEYKEHDNPSARFAMHQWEYMY